ncbi:MAG: hypothetical protein ACTJHU_10460 [Mycetocola sp.]
MIAAEDSPAVQAQPASFAGRTRIAPGALSTVARAVVAATLGVQPGAVSVRLSDHRGGLAVQARTPILFSSDRHDQLSWVQEQRALIADRVSGQTGAEVTSVTIEITGAVTTASRRVR